MKKNTYSADVVLPLKQTKGQILKQLSWVWNTEKVDLRNKSHDFVIMEEEIFDMKFARLLTRKK